MSTTHEHAGGASAVRFERVLVGIDGSEESREAARQAARLHEGELTLLACYDPTDALVGGAAAGVPLHFDDEAQSEVTREWLRVAGEAIAGTPHAESLGRGRSWDVLLEEVGRIGASLVSVGSHGTGRATGILLGSTTTELLHRAPCSVLVARAADEAFPARVVVGVDGSRESLVARATAEALAGRLGATLHVVEAERNPVAALLEASREADLVVLGSRGLTGLRALGSVSERVAHRAACSVLIVR